MVISWHASQGWLIHESSVEGPEVVNKAERLYLLGPAVLVRTQTKAWVECSGFTDVEKP